MQLLKCSHFLIPYHYTMCYKLQVLKHLSEMWTKSLELNKRGRFYLKYTIWALDALFKLSAISYRLYNKIICYKIDAIETGISSISIDFHLGLV